MTPQAFKHSWTDTAFPLVPLSASRLGRFNLLPATAAFLMEAGLPSCAAGNLTFSNDTDDIFYGINKLTEQWDFGEDRQQYDHYVVIGSCRDGDVIAINTGKNDEIEQLDPLDSFNAKFFNSSIHTLAGFLLIYTDFENSVLAEHGEEGKRNSYFTDIQFELLKARMLEADRRALTERGFWKEELEIILWCRQKYMDNLD